MSTQQEAQLAHIEPSKDQFITYFPCSVVLNDGSKLGCVYIVSAQQYIDVWGVWPDEDPAKLEVQLNDVLEILPSPNRIAREHAEKLYMAGESGMGYTVFTAHFKDGSSEAFVTGNAVDFITLRPGISPSDIIDVEPHEGRERAKSLHELKYYWCLYGHGKPRGTGA